MSVNWFELPPPAELGDGWSLRFLTAAQMLECRGEGEAMAAEARDKALWANAALLSRVLLKEGEPAFSSGEAVLASLTVGQIDRLTRRWWAQDDFAGQALRGEWPDPEGWATPGEWPAREGWPTSERMLAQEKWEVQAKRAVQEKRGAQQERVDREQGENETFDMARYLALGGISPEAAGAEAPAVEASGLARIWPQILSQTWPQVWSRRPFAPGEEGRVQRVYMPPYGDGGAVILHGGVADPMEVPPPSSGQTDRGAETPQAGHSVVQVMVPEAVGSQGGLTMEELDRAVERDARRYDGGSSLY